MEVGHLVDGHFGLIKKVYRHVDCDALVEATSYSTKNNIPQPFAWQWRNWEALVDPLFKLIPNIRKYHHFRWRFHTRSTVCQRTSKLSWKASYNFQERCNSRKSMSSQLTICDITRRFHLWKTRVPIQGSKTLCKGQISKYYLPIIGSI